MEETKTETQQPAGTVTLVSEKDMALKQMMESQGDFPDISVVEKFQNIFDLPKEALVKVKEYDFRWASKDTRMLERNLIKGWRICNRVLCSWFPSYVFSTNGAIEKYGHLLMFRPVVLGEAYRKKYRGISNDQIKAATKAGEKDKKGSPFYTPKSSGSDEEEPKPGEFVQDRDF